MARTPETVERSIGLITLVVEDYDAAIAFFTTALRFELVEDRRVDERKRWVVVAPPGSRGAGLLLARAANPEQAARIGDQTGGRVALFLETTSFEDDYQHMRSHGVRFTESPREEPYGKVAVFLDLHGNRWDLLERSRDSAGA